MSEPVFTMPPESISVSAGETVTVSCRVIGKPIPNVLWKSADGRVLLPSERVNWGWPEMDQYTITVIIDSTCQT